MGNTLYEQDFHAWTLQQADLLRRRQLDCADLANIAEEIEDMGRSVKRELTSRLAVLLLHLLKWQHQPAFRSRSWQLAINGRRRSLKRHLRDNPSLKSQLGLSIEDAYGDATIEAERATGLAAETFAELCPFSFDQAIDDGFWPDA